MEALYIWMGNEGGWRGKRETYQNWLMWLWRLRSPSICHLQARDLGKPVVEFQSMLKAKGSQWLKSQYKVRQSAGRSRGFLLPLPFVLFKSSTDWMMPAPIGEGIILLTYWASHFKCSSHSETPSQPYTKIIFNLDVPWLSNIHA